MPKISLPLTLLALITSIGGLLMGFDIGLISSILLFLKIAFHLSPLKEGLIASIIVPGTMLGALIMSTCGEKLRRTHFVILSACIALAGLLICALATSANQIIIARFIFGIAIGITLVNIPLYLSQAAPANKRGFAVTFFQLAITFGIMVGSGVGFWLSHSGNWRHMFFASICVAFLQLISGFMLLFVNERNTINFNQHSKAPINTSNNITKLLFMGNTLALLAQFTGINAIVYFAPQIFQTTSHTQMTGATFATWLMLIANFVFTIASLYIFDWYGRRNILLWSFILQSFSLFILSMALLFHYSAAYLFLILIMIYILGYAAGLGPGFYLIAAELYPQSIRNKAMGMTIFFNNLAAFMVICSFPTLLQSIGMVGMFLGYCIISLLGLGFVYYFIE